MKKLIAKFVDNHFTVNLMTVFLIVVGIISALMMSRDLLPSMQFDIIKISGSLPGASPLEVEEFVTYPIEEALSGVTDIDKIESTSDLGSFNISVIFKSGKKNMQQTLEQVRNSVSSLQYKLPTDIRGLNIEREAMDTVFVAWLSVNNWDSLNGEHIRALDRLKEKISTIPGISSVRSFEQSRNVFIRFDEKKLDQYEISITEIKKVLRQFFNFTPLGLYRKQGEDYTVQIARNIESLDDIKNLTIRSNMKGNGLKLKEIADVSYDTENQLSWYFVNGKNATGMMIQKSVGPDIINIDNKLKNVIDDFNKNNNLGLLVKTKVNGASFLKKQLDLLISNGFWGLITIMIILMTFLNFRVALMTALGIPIAYGGSLILLNLMGVSFDLFSIVGMLLVSGILVDDAIMVAEKYSDLLNEGLSRRDAAIEAASQIVIPVSGTITTTAVAFTPLIFIKSSMTDMLFALPVVVISSLACSWFESFFILPNHLLDFVKKGVSPTKEKYLDLAQNFYEKILKISLKLRYIVLIGIFCLTALAVYLFQNKIKKDFEMNIQPERLSVFIHLKKSESLEETLKTIEPIVKWMENKKDRFESLDVSVGSMWDRGRHLKGFKYAKINGFISSTESYPKWLKQKIKTEITPFLENLKKDPSSPYESLGSSFGWQSQDQDKGKEVITIKAFGKDDIKYFEIENELISKMKNIAAIKQYLPNPYLKQKTWQFKVKNDAISRYDLTPLDISQQVRGIFTPDEISQIRLDGKNIFVYAEFGKNKTVQLKDLDNLSIINPRGVSIPLKNIGSWEETSSLNRIEHLNKERVFNFDFEFDPDSKEKWNKDAVTKAMEPQIREIEKNYPQIKFQIQSVTDQEKDAQSWALKVTLFCLIAVFFVLALFLQSWTQPLVVSLPIPFSLTGVILALYLHDLPLGLMALVGIVGTIGISVNDSIVMMDQINRLAKEKRLKRGHIIKGAGSRFRSIMITGLSTLGGVFPMAYSIGGEIGFTQPLAFSMAWGLAFAIFLTLFFLPGLLVIREDIFNLRDFIFSRKKQNY